VGCYNFLGGKIPRWKKKQGAKWGAHLNGKVQRRLFGRGGKGVSERGEGNVTLGGHPQKDECLPISATPEKFLAGGSHVRKGGGSLDGGVKRGGGGRQKRSPEQRGHL